jgi:RNA polymerase sigma-54 factor
MVLLQPKLNVRLSQKQVLTPGLVQMVSVLALNKLELRDMITAEMVENPVLEELEASVPLLDEVSRREEDRDRLSPAASTEENRTEPQSEAKDPFDEVDFGQYFQEYLDPGYRSRQEWEEVEKPSFENFLSRPTTLTDHLMWQLSAMRVKEEVAEAAELVIGNLNEEGYLTASDDELTGLVVPEGEVPAPEVNGRKEAPSKLTSSELAGIWGEEGHQADAAGLPRASYQNGKTNGEAQHSAEVLLNEAVKAVAASPALPNSAPNLVRMPAPPPNFTVEQLREAIQIVQQMDPVGCAARDLRECLLAQVRNHQHIEEELNGEEGENRRLLADCAEIINQHLKALQKKEFKEIVKAMGRTADEVALALEYIKRLDPRPGLRYNIVQARLIEPDVAIFKQGDDYMVLMNDEDLPQLRLNPAYKKLLHREAAEKDVRVYVKERYKSAIQLIKNIEQRKQTILKVCHAIIRRQREFLDFGMDHLKPMMIKDVAEEIGVHPSTVSRAVASKYAHTPQGVFELRYFFSESVNGPEGEGMSLLILKRKVKKLIEEEDTSRPLTDEQITRILQSQGIQVTRRTVAKYREDMRIPSTHQRRVKD